LAWQSDTDSAGETSIQRLNITTGEYELVFNLPKNRTDPEFRSINSCAINPLDDILYCSMQINNAGSFLVRISADGEKVGFVCKLPQWQYSGVFDKDGNYYCNGEKSWSVVTGVKDIPTVPSLYSLSGDPFEEHFISDNMGADLVTFVEDLEQTGSPQTYIMSVQDTTATLIRVNPKPYNTTKLQTTGMPSGKTWAAAWTFKSTIYMAAEDGSGIVQFDMASINTLNNTCAFEEAGKSAKLEWNDGFTCPDGISGLSPTIPPKPDPWTKATTSTTTTTTTRPGKASDDGPPKTTRPPRAPDDPPKPPKIGQVRCMAKLSKFEGTTLKPDPSGKCKQCMKKLVNAQRCYE